MQYNLVCKHASDSKIKIKQNYGRIWERNYSFSLKKINKKQTKKDKTIVNSAKYEKRAHAHDAFCPFT